MTEWSLASSMPRVEHWHGQPGIWRGIYGGAGTSCILIIGQLGVWSAGGRLIILVRVVYVVCEQLLLSVIFSDRNAGMAIFTTYRRQETML